MKDFIDEIDWPKFTRIVLAKIGALRLTYEKFPDGPAKAAYASDLFLPVFSLLMQFAEATGGPDQWAKFSPEEIDMLAAHASVAIGTEFPAEMTVTLHDSLDKRVGEG